MHDFNVQYILALTANVLNYIDTIQFMFYAVKNMCKQFFLSQETPNIAYTLVYFFIVTQ